MTDSSQFEMFMKNYQDMVYSTAVRLLGNEADAEDISQAVFLKAYENFAGISQSPTAGGWLKTVTTNLCLNHLSRYRARWRFFSEMRSEEGDDDFSVRFGGPYTMEQGLAEADYRQLLEAAIKKLPAAQRVPLVLFHFESQGYEEISRQLRISLSKVKTDIHRGRLALKRYLKPGLKGEERWEEHPTSQKSPATPSRKRESEPPTLSLLTQHATRIIRHAAGI